LTSLLFVCSGNTCRSPLAEALTRREASRRNVEVTISSAGTMAADGAPASPRSVQAAARRGADLSAHRSRRLRPADLGQADLVLAMTSAHLGTLRIDHGRELNAGLVTDFLPEGHARRGKPVADPLGGTEEDYEEVARLLEECAGCILDRLAGS
jgi:protein-tyrosine-phosphatase